MEVRYGALQNVYGIPARSDGYIFMPAYVELGGGSAVSGHRLCDQFGDQAPPSLRYAISQSFDAAWVRARIPNIFGFTPEPAEVEKALLHLGFVAATGDGSVCYPFLCMDHYGKTALWFSDLGPDEIVKRSIADGFWGVMIQEPDELADFEQRVLWMNYGCRSGHVYCDESVG